MHKRINEYAQVEKSMIEIHLFSFSAELSILYILNNEHGFYKIFLHIFNMNIMLILIVKAQFHFQNIDIVCKYDLAGNMTSL